MARSNIDIRQLRGLYNTHKLQREECHSDSMQIACGHDPIWIVVGATQHGRSRFTGLAWQPSAIHWKRISSLEDLQAAPPPLKIGERKKKERNESDKQCKKGGIAFWGSLYSASFKKQYVNRADAEADPAGVSYWCRNADLSRPSPAPPSHATASLSYSQDVHTGQVFG